MMIWPPSLPDLNPLNLVIWGNVENKACSFSHPSIDALKASVEKEWAKMSVDFVKKMRATFRPRVEAMLKGAEGLPVWRVVIWS